MFSNPYEEGVYGEHPEQRQPEQMSVREVVPVDRFVGGEDL
jgi:hypothetical protein